MNKLLLRPRFRRADGFALVVVLLLLMALSMVGIGALRSVSLQEKMAGNLGFRNLAFQGAEGMLRESSARLESKLGSRATGAVAPSSTDPDYREFDPLGTNTSRLTSSSMWSGARTGASLARANFDVRGVSDSQATQRVQGCDAQVGAAESCNLVFSRISARVIDPSTGATSIVQQYWAYPPKSSE